MAHGCFHAHRVHSMPAVCPARLSQTTAPKAAVVSCHCVCDGTVWMVVTRAVEGPCGRGAHPHAL
uniref:Uncharacterized protein n=1 Tax=Ulva partita TaxID=1605170 RepID=A0A1C9ZW98_9CHLO|nr:hypothetical protein [Ulva partita]